MSRIVGISLATFLVMVQVTSYLMLSFADASFDESRRSSAALAAAGVSASHQPSWVREYDLKTREWRAKVSSPDAAVSLAENILIGWREGLSPDQVRAALTKPSAKEWFTALEVSLETYRATESKTPFSDLEHDLVVLKNRLARLDKKDFLLAARRRIAAAPNTLNELKKVLLKRLQSPALASADPRKSFVAEILIPYRATGRRFLEASNAGSSIVYCWLDKQAAKVVEAGFAYSSYRDYIHNLVSALSAITLAGFLLFILPFPAFFAITLVRPLRNLLDAVAQVQTGSLEQRLKVTASDEFGVLGHAFNAMTASIKEGRDALSRHANILEDKVKERTKKLEESLTDVQQLKSQQDGDYFLTSLLLNPLGKNRVTSERYKVDFLIRQKKRFDFRTWQSEIGGDLCISDHLQLDGRGYIVLLNADAMGKSMQGAGGAVVIGSIFHAIIERNRHLKKSESDFPEGWIRDTLAELQRVFVVFEGSMLVSLFLALIDENTGAMYFVNAEHPWPVLVRNKEATFLQHKLFLRKLGVVPPDISKPWSLLREDSPVSVETFQLCQGDVLIIGSDGRDDLMLGQSHEDARRIINEDEKLFLNVVKSANGDLPEILGQLKKVGELVDDLSLIKLDVNNGVMPARTMRSVERKQIATLVESEKFEVALQLTAEISAKRDQAAYRAFIYYQARLYEEADQQARLALQITPSKPDVLYLLSKISRKMKRLPEAIYFAERFRLRKPRHINNLVNLANLYLMQRELDRAEQVALQIIHLDETHAAARRLLKMLDETRIRAEKMAIEHDTNMNGAILNEIE